MRGFIVGVILTLLIIGVAGFLLIKKGYLSFNADQEPSFLESKLAMSAMDASTDRHAPDVKNPVPASEENLVAGAKLYIDHCAGCHGVPSNPDSQFGRSFYPVVPPFFKDAPDMPENQNFYIIQHGVRWTAMPSWKKTLSEAEMWQIVTFLSNIEKLPPAAMKEFQPPGSAAPPPETRPSHMPMNP